MEVVCHMLVSRLAAAVICVQFGVKLEKMHSVPSFHISGMCYCKLTLCFEAQLARAYVSSSCRLCIWRLCACRVKLMINGSVTSVLHCVLRCDSYCSQCNTYCSLGGNGP